MVIEDKDMRELEGWHTFLQDMWGELDDTVLTDCVKLLKTAYHWGYEKGFEEGFVKGQLEEDE